MILATPDSAGGRQDKKRSAVRQNSLEMARLTDGPKPGTPPPPRSPFLPPAPKPQLPPAAPALQQRAAAALVLALLSLIAMMLIGNLQRAVYVIAVALAVALVALILAISAMKAAKRAGSRTDPFHSVAQRAAARSVRFGPLPPMVIGGYGRCTGFGSQ